MSHLIICFLSKDEWVRLCCFAYPQLEDLDVAEVLIQGLVLFWGAIEMLSDDKHLIAGSSDEVCVIPQGKVAPIQGNFQDYRKVIIENEKLSFSQLLQCRWTNGTNSRGLSKRMWQLNSEWACRSKHDGEQEGGSIAVATLWMFLWGLASAMRYSDSEKIVT